MKLVLIADTHALHDQITLPDGDILIHAGDLCSFGTLPELERVVKWLGRLRRTRYSHVISIAGNHDWALYKTSEKHRARGMFESNHITYLEDSDITIEGVNFWGSPWTPNFYDWAFMYPRGSVMAKAVWNKVPGSTDVLITHGPPRGILDPAYSDPSGHAGCDDLLERVKGLSNLKLHVFGHLHDGYGKYTDYRTDYVNAAICNDFYQPVNTPIEVEI